MNYVEASIDRFRRRKARIGLIGLGYAGLPLAVCFAEAGFETIGFDIDPEKIRSLNCGASYIRHLPSELLAKLVCRGNLTATADFDCLAHCDAAIICVPTPLGPGRVPDLTYVTNTAREVAKRLHPGQLVVLESTTYPGTTESFLPRCFTSRASNLERTCFSCSHRDGRPIERGL